MRIVVSSDGFKFIACTYPLFRNHRQQRTGFNFNFQRQCVSIMRSAAITTSSQHHIAIIQDCVSAAQSGNGRRPLGSVSALGVLSGPVTTPYREPSVVESVSLSESRMRVICQSGSIEREQETGSCQTGLRRHCESRVECHRETKRYRPLFSTLLAITITTVVNVNVCFQHPCP